MTQFVGKNPPFKLLVHVVHFEVEYPPAAQNPASVAVDVQLATTLVRVTDQQILQQRQYHVRREQVAFSTRFAVVALNEAWSETLNQLMKDLR